MKKKFPPATGLGPLMLQFAAGLCLSASLFPTCAHAAPEIQLADPIELELNGDATQAFSIAIENVGDSGDLVVSSADFGGDPHFSIGTLPGSIEPGGSGELGIIFKPLGRGGQFSADLAIASNDAGTPTLTVTVRGVIHDPMILAPELVDLGSETGRHTITIGNGGESQELTVQSISMSGDTSAFRLRRFPLPFSPIPAGGTGDIVIDFDPGERDGRFQLSMRVFSDDPVVRPFVIEVVANIGIEDPLVAWWPLDGDATDASGNGHDGTLIGAPAPAAGASPATAGALQFDGAGARLEVPYADALNPDDFTVTLWAKPHGAIAGRVGSVFASRDGSPGPATHGLALNLNDGAWNFWTGDGDAGWDQLGDPAATADDRWWHLAISYDSATDTKRLYADGELVASDNVAESGSTQYSPNGSSGREPLHIGAGQDDGSGDFFDGEIDDVALFRVALSEAEIQTIMNQGVARFIAAGRPFQITQVEVAPAGNALTLLWNSEPDTDYAVDRSTDLNAIWLEIEESVPATGTATAYTDSELPEGEGRVFYRVRPSG